MHAWTILREVLGEIGAEPTLEECSLACPFPIQKGDRQKEFLCMLLIVAHRNGIENQELKWCFADIGTLLLTGKWEGGSLPLYDFLLKTLRFEILPKVGWDYKKGLKQFLEYVKGASRGLDGFKKFVETQGKSMIDNKVVSLVQEIIMMEAQKRNLKTPAVEVVICADEKIFKEAYKKYYNDRDDTTHISGFCKQGKVYVRSSSPILVLSHEFWHAVQQANNLPLRENEADEVAYIVHSQFLSRLFKDATASGS